jgi:hypothetical protein
MRPSRLVIALCLALPLLLSWSGSTAAATSERQVWSPGSFYDSLGSTIASDGKRLWLATMGQNRRGKVRTEVMEFSGSHCRRLGGKPPSTSGYELFLALLPGKRTIPCLGDHRPPSGSPRIRCFRNGQWQTLSYPARFRRSELGSLVTRRGHLEASFVKRGGTARRPTFELTQLRFGRRGARVVAPPIKLDGLWHGQPVATTRNSSRGPLKLDLWDANTGRRMIMTRSGTSWRRSAVFPGDGLGSTSGSRSVLAGGSIVSPSTKLLRKEFYGGREESTLRLSLMRLDSSGWSRIGEGPLDSGEGAGQGGVFPVGNRVWAVWIEQKYEGVAFGGMLPTRYRAVRLNRSLTGIDREVELWSGETVFPGSVDAIEYRGRVAFLYDRQRPSRGGLVPTVDLRFRKGS